MSKIAKVFRELVSWTSTENLKKMLNENYSEGAKAIFREEIQRREASV